MKLTGLLLLLLAGVPAFCQKNTPEEDVHATLLVGKKKSLIAYAGPAHSFTMETTSKTAKPSDIPGFITIDGQVLQSTLVPAALSVDPRHPTTDREKEILVKYMNYELGYYKRKLKQKYSGLQTEWLTLKGRLFLVWYFDMPKDYKLVSRQIYLSTLFFDQVLDLNAPVFKMDHFAKARTTLVKLAGSLKTYDKQLDLGLLKRQL
ncbi:MAG TPA: hypothetical protein VF939_01825 [Puia sp.]